MITLTTIDPSAAPSRFVAAPALPGRADSPWFVFDQGFNPVHSVAVCPGSAEAGDVVAGLELLRATRAIVLVEIVGAPV